MTHNLFHKGDLVKSKTTIYLGSVSRFGGVLPGDLGIVVCEVLNTCHPNTLLRVYVPKVGTTVCFFMKDLESA